MLGGLSAWVALAGGCRDKAAEVSSGKYLLERLDEFWNMARGELQSDRPNLHVFLTIREYLGYRVPRRLEKDYTGPDKGEVLAKARHVWDRFDREVFSRLSSDGGRLGLKPGVTIEGLRSAFAEVDREYQAFRGAASGG
jgi:hypothetical protein